jgi:hypothetical protein
VAKKPRLRITDRIQAAKTVEEELRPNLPAVISDTATWTLRAKQLMDESPEAYTGIIAKLADGESNKSLAGATGLPIQLIRRIRELHPAAIEAGKRAVHSRLEEALHSVVDRLVDNVDKLPITQLAVNAAILVDKTQLLSGNATSRVEHVKPPTKEDLDAFYNSLPQAVATEVPK